MHLPFAMSKDDKRTLILVENVLNLVDLFSSDPNKYSSILIQI